MRDVLLKNSLKKERIDWPAVHVRLAANERALAHALTPTPQRIEEVFRSRAARLAQSETQNAPASAVLPVLVFRLGQERYAIEIAHLAEVLPFGYFAPVPGSPAPFLGIISVRGELRAVVDLAHVLAPSAEAANPAGFVLMLRPGIASEQIGLKVDSIDELAEIRPEELAQPDAASLVTRLAQGSLALLRIDAVLANIFSSPGVNTVEQRYPNHKANEESFSR